MSIRNLGIPEIRQSKNECTEPLWSAVLGGNHIWIFIRTSENRFELRDHNLMKQNARELQENRLRINYDCTDVVFNIRPHPCYEFRDIVKCKAYSILSPFYPFYRFPIQEIQNTFKASRTLHSLQRFTRQMMLPWYRIGCKFLVNRCLFNEALSSRRTKRMLGVVTHSRWGGTQFRRLNSKKNTPWFFMKNYDRVNFIKNDL